MTYFFETIEQVNQFTSSLALNRRQIVCANCNQSDQFVSHGFVYKKHFQGKTITVGKRLFCANRRQRTGCGSTLRLYLATQIPRQVCSALQMTIFLKALLARSTVQHAYQLATKTLDPRNAYRWLNKLKARLGDYRTFVQRADIETTAAPGFATRRLQLLLPIIKRICLKTADQPCQGYQMQTRLSFI